MNSENTVQKILNFNWHDNIENEQPAQSNELNDNSKIKLIEYHFARIMEALGLNLEDESLQGTPARVAKMYVNEIFSGLKQNSKPEISLFQNNYGYNKMIIEKDITLYSTCEHHFVPIIGKVHVAYIPNGQVIGLSKINRLVQYYAKRPQVQERLTVQISDALKDALGHAIVAVVIDAVHLCVASRGIKKTSRKTVTISFSGQFELGDIKKEFLSFVNIK